MTRASSRVIFSLLVRLRYKLLEPTNSVPISLSAKWLTCPLRTKKSAPSDSRERLYRIKGELTQTVKSEVAYEYKKRDAQREEVIEDDCADKTSAEPSHAAAGPIKDLFDGGRVGVEDGLVEQNSKKEAKHEGSKGQVELTGFTRFLHGMHSPFV